MILDRNYVAIRCFFFQTPIQIATSMYLLEENGASTIHNSISDGIKEVSISNLKPDFFFLFLIFVSPRSHYHIVSVDNRRREIKTRKMSDISLNDLTNFAAHLIYLSAVMMSEKCNYGLFSSLFFFIHLRKMCLVSAFFFFSFRLICVVHVQWQELKRLIKVNTSD